uniref:SCP domain-containing protein n=1 Tax=Panagrellus redivivus TaxID=6233 RepID=A0A7E4W197_PANRE
MPSSDDGTLPEQLALRRDATTDCCRKALFSELLGKLPHFLAFLLTLCAFCTTKKMYKGGWDSTYLIGDPSNCSTMKKFFRKRLRKSHSVHEDTRNRIEPNADPTAATSSNGGLNGGLAQSKTFDAVHGLRSADYHSLTTEAGSSTMSNDEQRFNPLLDRAMMQTITDVKYVKRRPKFTAVSSANFQRSCLEAHNFVRLKYGVPMLVWSQELAELAKSWAIKLADRGRILYPELPDIGENITLSNDTSDDHLTTGEELVALWAKQAKDVDFDKPKWSIKSKDFTQMIWRSSIEMGVCRYWNTTKNCLAIVAFYRPAGNSNAPGEFAANVPRRDALPEDILEATDLDSLLAALTRSVTIADAGFKS